MLGLPIAEIDCLPNRNETAMRRLHKFSKWVTAIALLLPALQSLQITSLLCHFCGNCGVNAESRHDCCCKKPNALNKNEAARDCRVTAPARGTLVFLRVATRSCGCPSDCWCHQPQQPQLQEARSVIVRSGAEFEVAIIDRPFEQPVIVSVDVIHVPPRNSHASAQQRCAVFCRFLA